MALTKTKRELRIVPAECLSDDQYDELAAIQKEAYREMAEQGINFRGADMSGADLKALAQGGTFFIVYQGESPISFGRGKLETAEDGVFLRAEGICTPPQFRRYNPGVRITRSREQWAKEQGAVYSLLDTACRAKHTVRYHRANGYIPIGYNHWENKNYISIMMRKDYVGKYPTSKRLKRLIKSWIRVHLKYTEMGQARYIYRAYLKLKDIFSSNR